MIYDLIKSITAEINKIYPNAKIYDSVVHQGIKLPCFFISSIDINDHPELKDYLKQKIPFVITYIADDKDTNYMDAVYKCMDLFSEAFRYIEVQGKQIKLINKGVEYDSEQKAVYIKFEASLRFKITEQGEIIEKYTLKGVKIHE